MKKLLSSQSSPLGGQVDRYQLSVWKAYLCLHRFTRYHDDITDLILLETLIQVDLIVISMATKDDLMAGFAGESMANRKYAIFSDKATAEGFKNVGTLFKAASLAEEIHARRHLQVFGISSTKDNLKEAIEGETEEFTNMYPEFIKQSQAEGNEDATRSFTYAMKAEEVHAGLYEKALKAVSAGKDLEISKVLLCPVCGNVALDSAPAACPICGVPGKKFQEVTI